eukprot:1133671-Pelagomonas_calceolata.AAC.24
MRVNTPVHVGWGSDDHMRVNIRAHMGGGSDDHTRVDIRAHVGGESDDHMRVHIKAHMGGGSDDHMRVDFCLLNPQHLPIMLVERTSACLCCGKAAFQRCGRLPKSQYTKKLQPVNTMPQGGET